MSGTFFVFPAYTGTEFLQKRGMQNAQMLLWPAESVGTARLIGNFCGSGACL
jgi:hypothetical protein